MKFEIGKVYLFGISIVDDEEMKLLYIKIMGAFEYRDGYESKSYKYVISFCDEDGGDVSDETHEWTEKGLLSQTRMAVGDKKRIIEYYEDKIEIFKYIIKDLKRIR